jgi:predicted phage terminase large subunit-like protein
LIAELETTRKQLARRRLLAFTEYTNAVYVPAGHHQRIAEKLEAVERGEIDRLMIFMPPRHGKSELASKRFPAWCLGRNPKRQIIAASYNSDLASDFGRNVRNIVASPEFGQVFAGVSLAADSQAANRMNTNRGGTYVAAGVGTAVTGRGADIALIDDPFKDREEADSERRRDTVWDWYRSTLYTRLMPGGAIVLIQTRWHEDDLAGRLLEHEGRVEDGGQWTVLDLPAIDADGVALWPEWYDVPALNRIKETIGPREWSALYQQQPQPDEGSFFVRDWFNEWTEKPALNIYASSDYAVTDEGGDWTVFCIWGVDSSGNLYRLEMWKVQANPMVWIEKQCEMIRKWKPLAWFGEAGVIQKAIEPMLRRRMIETHSMCRLEWISSIADKPTRARAFQARAEMGKVYFEQGADISEFLKFPAGKHDDEVDCATMMGRVLDETHPAIVRTVAQNTGPLPGDYRKRPSNVGSSAWG